MTKYLHVGGLVAAGLDSGGQYLLTVSHSGRGVWSTSTWERVARDSVLAYPTAGQAIGIGPIEGALVPVTELDHASGTLAFTSEDGSTRFLYESGMIEVQVVAPPNTSLERTRDR